MKTSKLDIIKDGLWYNNPGLVQLLGLCPLLAVTTNVINGLGLGMATLVVLSCSNFTVALIRNFVSKEIRIPVFVIIIAAFVTEIELLMHAYFYELFKNLSIFIPLIVTNCVIIGRAEAFASKNTVNRATLDGFMMGLGFTLILCILGGMREIIGEGTLFAQAEFMFGDSAKVLTLHIAKLDHSFLLATLPPGAFIGLGLLIACKNYIDQKRMASDALPVIAPQASQATSS